MINELYDSRHFTRDAATVEFDTDADGISENSDGHVEIDWDAVETVTIDEAAIPEAFDAKEFYRLPATVARPIPQTYRFGEDEVVLKKPREELKKAAWSLDNSSWVMGHPETGMVKNADDVRGFWRGADYIDSLDELNSAMHIPVHDEEAQDYVERNTDVSVGFYNRVARTDEYDGVVGGTDSTESVDGYQTDMIFDHVASVERGRCPSDKGCGLDAAHGHSAFISGTIPTDKGREEAESTSMEETDASKFVNDEDGRWYAVPPSDNQDSEWKFPITSCDGEDSVDSAWHFAIRERGDISISFDTLKERIRQRADELDCDIELSESTDTSLDELDVDGWYEDALDGCGCGCGGECESEKHTETMEFDIDTDDVEPDAVLDKVASEHDGVDDRLTELRSAQNAVEAAEAALDKTDADELDELAETIEDLQDELEDLRSFKDEQEREEMQEHAEVIAESTDRFGDSAEDVVEAMESLDEIKEKRELVEELSGETSDKIANDGSEDGGSQTVDPGGYANSPWE